MQPAEMRRFFELRSSPGRETYEIRTLGSKLQSAGRFRGHQAVGPHCQCCNLLSWIPFNAVSFVAYILYTALCLTASCCICFCNPHRIMLFYFPLPGVARFWAPRPDLQKSMLFEPGPKTSQCRNPCSKDATKYSKNDGKLAKSHPVYRKPEKCNLTKTRTFTMVSAHPAIRFNRMSTQKHHQKRPENRCWHLGPQNI